MNIGNNSSVNLIDFISILEKEIGIKAIKDFYQMQAGDVINTLSDNKIITEWIGNYPRTSLNKGIKSFVNWYKDFYKKIKKSCIISKIY